ncbi:MAG: hypothetical protein ALECFALPRED_007244 [Alectoria fallacina]|uniref:Uncharacterized protein n=1 Tax=Alectoria fallacina TaxID=1903189 RepID=A0A8H3IRC1_9LECA|nr:MAG: hypothetical protein ALECFALPRED_007244 [Alectoria fallacina]
MDSDGFAVQGRRRGGTREHTRDRDQASFLRDVPKYAGTSEDFERAHAQRYGREEGLGRDGKHSHGSLKFPHGSDREKLHTQYSASTKGRDATRNAYKMGLRAAKEEHVEMKKEQREYYRDNTGGLPPHQHERLDPRAKEYRDKCYSNATNRENFLRAHPHGYHTMGDQHVHHEHAENAYGEYEYARDQQKHHEQHRS